MDKMKKYLAACILCLAAFICGSGTALATDAQPDAQPVYVTPPSDTTLDSTLCYGARVVIPEGTKYYASADGGGSGAYGVIGNRYTPMGTDLYVGGFARLDDSGQLLEYRAYNPPYTPVKDYWANNIDGSVLHWDNTQVVIFRDPEGEKPLGWVPARSIAVTNGILGDDKTNAAFKNGVIITDIDDIDGQLEPDLIDSNLPDPGNAIEDNIILGQKRPDTGDLTTDDPFVSTREIAYAIEDYVEDGKKVALLMDASNSVTEYVADIASYGAYIEKVNKADEIIAFGWNYQIISAEDYLDAEVDRRGTDLYTPLGNLSDVSYYDRIIIITDTYHNILDATIPEIPEFVGKIVVVCTGPLNSVDTGVITGIEDAFHTTAYLCRLDNELDRIRALGTLKR